MHRKVHGFFTAFKDDVLAWCRLLNWHDLWRFIYL